MIKFKFSVSHAGTIYQGYIKEKTKQKTKKRLLCGQWDNDLVFNTYQCDEYKSGYMIVSLDKE